VTEPGLDLHYWQTLWEDLEPLLEESPEEALPEVDDLVGRMLVSRGFVFDDPVVVQGEEPEIVVSFRAAREVARRLDRGEEVSDEDIETALETYRATYEHLVEHFAAP
jgi:acyl-CoA synthetase (AMP-forming)/AMP-acid ligase II